MKIYDSVLKPCPFCGNKKSVHAYTYKDAVYRQYAVKCNKCGARIMGASTELAIDKWNCRAERTAKVLKHKYYLSVSLNVVGESTIGYEWICENCKKKVIDGEDYCSHCGAKLAWGDEDIPMEYFESGGI